MDAAFALRPVVRVPNSGTRYRGSKSVACVAGPRSSWSLPLAPLAPPPACRLCSQASQLLRQSLASPARASSASATHLPNAARRPVLALTVKLEISRFPNKERACMPGSSTTPGRTPACDGAPMHVAFRGSDSVGTRIEFLTRLNGWPACTPVNASRRTSRYAAHDSGTTGFARSLL